MPKFKVEVEIVMVQDREIRMHSVTFVDSIEEAMAVAKSFEEQNDNRGFITVWDVAKDDIVHEQPLNKHIVLI
jgi:hypothetical protein